MLRKMMLGVVVVLAGAGMVWGQELPKPGPEHEHLKELQGNWDAVMEMGGQKSKCTASYKSIGNGLWLTSDFQGDLGGVKFEGHGIDGYDVKRKKYVGVWVDSFETAPMHFEGNYDEKKKLLVMTGESVGPDGKPQKFKTTTERKDKEHFTFKMYMVDADGNEKPAFTIEYSRR